MTDYTPMHVPVGVRPTVDEAHLERVACDSSWVSRVLVAAAQALNTLDHRVDDIEAREQAAHVLRAAFTDWDAVLEILDLQRSPAVETAP